MKKTIINTEQLISTLNLKINNDDKKIIDHFFKKKVMHINNKRIIYPKVEELIKKEREFTKIITKLEKDINYWKNKKNKIERDKILFPITIYFKKNFWRHKIKELTNKEYKQDVIDSKLNDKILLDPEYKNLFETFIINPDYRKKLKETINNSIVYRNNGIGLYGDKKKEFKIKTSELKVNQLIKQIKDNKEKKLIFTKIIEIVKKNN